MPPAQSAPEVAPAGTTVLLAFDRSNRLLLPTSGPTPCYVREGLALSEFMAETPGLAELAGLRELAAITADPAATVRIFGGLLEVPPAGWRVCTLADWEREVRTAGDSALEAICNAIQPVLVDIPYLDLSENDYIYRFRTAKERNRGVYLDSDTSALYQSQLCSAIKVLRRVREKTSGEPVLLDFGPVRYRLPSHFGFCLGVQNAVERAYETIAENPGKRVFMLSELIHNPFVNADLQRRGLRYLQSDKGVALDGAGRPVSGRYHPDALWSQIGPEDLVIIPAFGATNEDKVDLIKRGIPVRAHDATCMLVEKVWKAGRRYARQGFTVVIHGKAEHEETKATFSNTARHGPALIIRNLEQARELAEIMREEPTKARNRFAALFRDCCSDGLDPVSDLQRLAVINQTTLLRNETLRIIEFLRGTMVDIYGEERIEAHFWSQGKADTLCYATQVNQDALVKALDHPVDAALVVGGRNSSNTFQLYRMCEASYGPNAHYIQSEANIVDFGTILHYQFPKEGPKGSGDEFAERRFLEARDRPLDILITGGASCPDGIIQQVITRINRFFQEAELAPIDAVVKAVEAT